MLSLAAPTDPSWAPRVLARLDDLLVDHAHCEKKAASTALSLLFRYPERAEILEPLSRLAREELVHFEQVLALLAARGVRFRHQRPSPYAGRLVAAARSHEPSRLLDLLLCAALIEARSCERFALLAAAAADPELAAFYRGLLASEARHHGVYVELARAVAGAEATKDRLAALAVHEAQILKEMPALPRMHA